MAAMFDDALKNETQSLKGDHLRTVSVNFGPYWPSFLSVVQENVKIPIGSNVKLCRVMAAILDGGQQNQTRFLKGTIQGPFHQSLVKIGLTVSD